MLCLVTTIWWLFSVTSFCKKFLALNTNQLVTLPLSPHLLWKLVRNPEVSHLKATQQFEVTKILGYLRKTKFKQILDISLCCPFFLIVTGCSVSKLTQSKGCCTETVKLWADKHVKEVFWSFLNTAWFYEVQSENATFQCYSHLLLTIFKRSTL